MLLIEQYSGLTTILFDTTAQEFSLLRKAQEPFRTPQRSPLQVGSVREELWVLLYVRCLPRAFALRFRISILL